MEIHDHRAVYNDHNVINIMTQTSASTSESNASFFSVFYQNAKNGRVFNMGTLQFASKDKLIIIPDHKLTLSHRQIQTQEDSEISAAEATSTHQTFSIAGDFKENKFIIVQKNDNTRKQKLVGESFGRALIRKTVRESKWVNYLDVEKELAGEYSGGSGLPDFGQLILAAVVLVNVHHV
jgi:hypothetical protein